MNLRFRKSAFMASTILVLTAQVVFSVVNARTTLSQSEDRKLVTPKDYGKWESIGRGGALSSNGEWLVYPIQRNNDHHELRLHHLKDASKKIIKQGSIPQFSKDSQWLGYLITVSPEESKKLKKQKKPLRNQFGLLGLTTGDSTVIKNVTSFAFGGNSQFVAIKHYRPEGKKSRGSDLVVRNLKTGSHFSFGNVTEYNGRFSRRYTNCEHAPIDMVERREIALFCNKRMVGETIES